MAHRWMSHVTHMNALQSSVDANEPERAGTSHGALIESCHKYGRVMSHTWMGRGALWCHTWRSDVTHMNVLKSSVDANEPELAGLSHGAHNESWRT